MKLLTAYCSPSTHVTCKYRTLIGRIIIPFQSKSSLGRFHTRVAEIIRMRSGDTGIRTPYKTAKNPVTAVVTVAVTDHVLAQAVYTLIRVLKKLVVKLIRISLENIRYFIIFISIYYIYKNILCLIYI